VSRVLLYVNESDLRLSGRLLDWAPPRWFRTWMIWTSKLGDGWLWLLTGLLLALGGTECHRALAAGAVSMGLANPTLVVLKKRFRRRRPCDLAPLRSFEVRPLNYFREDCFSFPSGHALNAFALVSVVALCFPPLAPIGFLVAATVGASRVVLGLHFVSDVLVGAIIGVLIGTASFLAVAG
jgi:undecaprenyl-diphosphatase